ncbi:hypothetical protein AX16_010867 [Volvariella volvacea WC 439]|nr:hypothetical protein AX16_010867 [Volvariella volvacea WC 439]
MSILTAKHCFKLARAAPLRCSALFRFSIPHHNSRTNSSAACPPGTETDLFQPLRTDEAFDATDESYQTAPIMTEDAVKALGTEHAPQLAAYGRVLSQTINGVEQQVIDSRLYINSNAPFSGVICGLQGTGKSHSTAVLMESCLIQDERLGSLPKPLSTVVFHFDPTAGEGQGTPCEAAYLSTLNPQRGRGATPPKVTVLVLPSRLEERKYVYADLPNVEIRPLYFSPTDINSERLLSVMKWYEGQGMGIYMEVVLAILRGMSTFSYEELRKKMKERSLPLTNKQMLELRLTLLDSCLNGGSTTNSVSTYFEPGHLTIIDLSSPFVDSSSACSFFDLILWMFLEKDINTGKLIVLDEAHKYLRGDGGGSSKFIDTLLFAVREKRHANTRILVSTQEPTIIPPGLLELSSFIIAHRISAPKWLRYLSDHVAGAQQDILPQLITLKTGQALVFSSSGLVVKPKQQQLSGIPDSQPMDQEGGGELTPLGQGYLCVQARARVTVDGGRSELATSKKKRKPVRLETATKEKEEVQAPTDDKTVERFEPLTTVLQQAKAEGRDRLGWGEVSMKVRQDFPSAFKGKFRMYVEAAQDAGLVNCGGPKRQWVGLATPEGS